MSHSKESSQQFQLEVMRARIMLFSINERKRERVDLSPFNFSEQECHSIASKFREKLKIKICFVQLKKLYQRYVRRHSNEYF